MTSSSVRRTQPRHAPRLDSTYQDPECGFMVRLALSVPSIRQRQVRETAPMVPSDAGNATGVDLENPEKRGVEARAEGELPIFPPTAIIANL